MEKEKIKQRHDEILQLIKGFCDKKLDNEYYELSEKLLNKLSRKREVPFIRGKSEVWAAAIIHVIGTVNFLFDKSFKPYSTVEEINNYFGTNQSTTGGKSKQIRDLLKIGLFNTEFSTQKMQSSNPYNNMVMVNGIITPISIFPEESQEIIKQAKKDGVKKISIQTRFDL